MENKKIKLSVAIATYNEEKNIKSCLDSVQSLADEIVVVDGGSSDNTLSIIKKYKAKIIQVDNPAIFHINKQKALDACRGNWILQLDADEVVTPELQAKIMETISNKQKEKDNINGYYIPRKNFFWGHWMQKGGQYPDYVIRLIRRGKARFPCKSVHEQIEVDGPIGYLKEPLYHYAYKTYADYWKKADAYTTLEALEMKKQQLQITLFTRFSYCLIRPTITFLSIFARHKGFLDGWYGLVFAYWSALHFPIAYQKYREQRAKSRGQKNNALTLLIIFLLFAFCFLSSVNAAYVLPYPSYMPGNKLYRVSRIIDKVKNYWYFGNIAQSKYHMNLSDKYLVEAKTLFEYQQYLLAIDALTRSGEHLKVLPVYFQNARKEGKDMQSLSRLIDEEINVHNELLYKLKSDLPPLFIWQPERQKATELRLHELLDQAILDRLEIKQSFLQEP